MSGGGFLRFVTAASFQTTCGCVSKGDRKEIREKCLRSSRNFNNDRELRTITFARTTAEGEMLILTNFRFNGFCCDPVCALRHWLCRIEDENFLIFIAIIRGKLWRTTRGEHLSFVTV